MKFTNEQLMQLIEVVNEKVATMIYEDNHTSRLPPRTRVIGELNETIDTLLQQYKHQQRHATKKERVQS